VLGSNSGKEAYRVAHEMCTAAGIQIEQFSKYESPKSSTEIDIDAQLDYIASFDIKNDGLLRTILGAVRSFENAGSDSVTLSYRSVALLAGISKSDVEKYLFLLCPRQREEKLQSLQWQLDQAMNVSSMIYDDITIHEMIETLPAYHAERLQERSQMFMDRLIALAQNVNQNEIDKHNEDMEKLRVNSIKSIRNRVTKIMIDIARIENYNGPDILTMINRDALGAIAYQLIARDCGQSLMML